MTKNPSVIVKRLRAGYAGNEVLHGVDLEVNEGEVVTLLGRNGAGKSTTLKCLMGLVQQRSGSILHQTQETIALPPEKIAKLGMAYCPEDRGIFTQLSVLENLLLPPVIRPGGMSLEEIYELFPNLYERSKSAGTKLSGGEQQMLAIARILRTGCKFLLLDEPSEGLAPVIVKQIGKTIELLKRRGYTVLLVEQNLRFALDLADRHYVMETGSIVDELSANDAITNIGRIETHLGV